VWADAEELGGRLPVGLDSQLGHKFDGVELSEGQWQKNRARRASMRPDPLLLVLDKPTASLGVPSEHANFECCMTCARELAQRTSAITVIVSHRFSTVGGADLILVLDQGRLANAGTRSNLLSAVGRDARAVQPAAPVVRRALGAEPHDRRGRKPARCPNASPVNLHACTSP
jgi:ABC-type multidrug transport system fused ATPase/permease subunit